MPRDLGEKPSPVRGHALTRKASKARTRSRLLAAALRILDEEGETALTTTNVTAQAGIAQSSFYAHFADMQELLHYLIEDLSHQRLLNTRAARGEWQSAPADLQRARETFRTPIAHSIAHPRVLRLLIRSRTDRTTPLGDWSRRIFEENRTALVEDLIRGGMVIRSEADRRRAEMVADGIIAISESLMLGHLEGRYPDIEEIIDTLMMFSHGYFPLIDPERRPNFGT